VSARTLGGSLRGLTQLAGFALACYLVFAILGSFVPFDFTPLSAEEASARVATALSTMPMHVSRIDVLSNVILFVPIGVLLTAWMGLRQYRVSGGIVDVWLALMASAALALVIEALQVYFPSRNVSPTDIMAETTGGLIGAWVWVLVGRFAVRALHAASAGTEDRSLAGGLLAVYAVLLAAAGLVPFDITLDPSELGAKLRAGRIALVPFAAASVDPAMALTHALPVVLAAAPLGALLVWATRRALRPAALALGVLFLAGVEAGQVLVVSRVADITDIVLGALGLLAGAALAASLAPDRPAYGSAGRMSRMSALLATCLWIAGVAATEWAPYTFTTNPSVVEPHWASLFATPFLNYFRTSEWNAFLNLIQRMTLIAPFGFLVSLSLGVEEAPSTTRTTLAVLVTSTVLFLVELGQVFVPGRSPDITDVILGTIGGCAGIGLLAWAPSAFTTTAPAGRERYELV
jgi:glycopeptide antibiotics resistance protein